MNHIFATILFYLTFNIAIWMAIADGGILTIALANIIAAITTWLIFRKQVKKQGWKPKPAALLGSIGILLIVIGLRIGHTQLPVAISMEAVYNGFAMVTWPLFLILNKRWPNKFGDKPNSFDLICHFVMAGLVLSRFLSYGRYDIDIWTVGGILLAITGYCLFNISIKLSGGHRATNITMNIGGGILLFFAALVTSDLGHWTPSPIFIGGIALGAASIVGLVHQLGAAYGHKTFTKKTTLIPPLVYDGLLVMSPLVSLFTEQSIGDCAVYLIAGGMLTVTIFRWKYHPLNKTVLST